MKLRAYWLADPAIDRWPLLLFRSGLTGDGAWVGGFLLAAWPVAEQVQGETPCGLLGCWLSFSWRPFRFDAQVYSSDASRRGRG